MLSKSCGYRLLNWHAPMSFADCISIRYVSRGSYSCNYATCGSRQQLLTQIIERLTLGAVCGVATWRRGRGVMAVVAIQNVLRLNGSLNNLLTAVSSGTPPLHSP